MRSSPHPEPVEGRGTKDAEIECPDATCNRPTPRRPASRWAGPAAWLALLLPLAGCDPLDLFAPSETDILQAGTVEPDELPPPEPVYCYGTLAEVDCFRTPQPGEADRLVNAYAPVPEIDRRSAPARGRRR